MPGKRDSEQRDCAASTSADAGDSGVRSRRTATGRATIAARAALVDELVRGLWAREVATRQPKLASGVALVAIGGYGRGEAVSLLGCGPAVCCGRRSAEQVKEPIRRCSQELWDCGMRVSLKTRKPKECETFDADNAEFALALLDQRLVAGDAAVSSAGAEAGRRCWSGRDGRRLRRSWRS